MTVFRASGWHTSALAILAMAGPAPARPQEAAASAALRSSISSFVAPFLANGDFEGVVLVRHGDDTRVFESYTRAEGDSQSFGPDTPFMVGSITKTFTAEAIARLASAGLLSLDDPVTRFVPELTGGDAITVEHVLNHSSGIPDYYSAPGFAALAPREMPPDRLSVWISGLPLDFAPGTASAYSNTGYNLLALIVERVSGMPFAAYLRREIIGPVGLANTGTLGETAPPGIPNGLRPAPAPRVVGPPLPLHWSWLVGSGSIYASAEDLVRWGREVAEREIGGPDGWHPYGWGVRTAGDRRFLVQNGRIPGYAAMLVVSRADDLVVVALSRIESDAVTRVANGVATLALGGVAPPEAERAEAALTEEGAASLEGVYDFGPDFALTVRRQEGGLGVAVGTGADLRFGILQPLGSDRFFFREAYLSVDFTREEDGTVNGMLWAGGGPFPKRR